MMYRCFCILVAVYLVASSSLPSTVAADEEWSPPGQHHHRKLRRHRRETRIDEYFLIMFGPGVSDVHSKVSSIQSTFPEIKVIQEFHLVFKGAALHIPDFTSILELLDDENIIFAEEEGLVISNLKVQNDATWGLDRIDQSKLPLNKRYKYEYTGAGTSIYILDTGILASHSDFSGRASCEQSFVPGEACTDKNGHGTHVGATAGGDKYGVAKDAKVIGIKVLNNNGSGDYGTVIAGVEAVIEAKRQSPSTPMVINMSLGGEQSDAVDAAVNAAVAAGIVVVVAAGNDYGADACTYSPAGADKVITVAALAVSSFFTQEEESFAYFSNQGRCVDIIAPGVDILSAWSTSDTSTSSISGTSMASPHVAGVSALYLEKHPNWTPRQVKDALQADSVTGPEPSFSFEPTTNRLLCTRGLLSTTDEPDDDVVDDDELEDDDPILCDDTFASCSKNSDCCTNYCYFDMCMEDIFGGDGGCGGLVSSCSSHSDCCSSLYCNFGYCFTDYFGARGGGDCGGLLSSCDSQNDCCSSLYCSFGLCFEEHLGATGGDDCGDWLASCTSNADCCSSQYCSFGFCLEDYSGDGGKDQDPETEECGGELASCQSNSDCCSSFYCSVGYCFKEYYLRRRGY